MFLKMKSLFNTIFIMANWSFLLLWNYLRQYEKNTKEFSYYNLEKCALKYFVIFLDCYNIF